MKYSILIGLLLISIASIIYYITNIDYNLILSDKIFIFSTFFSCGIGMIIGGFLGWLYKKPKIKLVEVKEDTKDNEI